jgi:hypothetical protein
VKKGLVITAPDVPHGGLALFSDSFEAKTATLRGGLRRHRADGARPGPTRLGGAEAGARGDGIARPQTVTSELSGSDGLRLITADKAVRAGARAYLPGY